MGNLDQFSIQSLNWRPRSDLTVQLMLLLESHSGTKRLFFSHSVRASCTCLV